MLSVRFHTETTFRATRTLGTACKGGGKAWRKKYAAPAFQWCTTMSFRHCLAFPANSVWGNRS